jgi:predicted metalloprotease
VCPHAKNFNQEEAKEDGMSGNALVAMMRPEVIESFGNWMIVERRGQRQNRKVAEDMMEVGILKLLEQS